MLLPLEDLCPEFFVESTGKERHRTPKEEARFRLTFLKEFIKQGERYGARKAAYEEACRVHDRPIPKAVSNAAYKILRQPAVEKMLAHLRARAVDEAVLEVAEFYRSLRHMQRVAFGLEPVKTAIVSKEGEVQEVDMLMPNPANQAKSVELMGKALSMFTDKVEHSGEGGGLLSMAVRFVEPDGEPGGDTD